MTKEECAAKLIVDILDERTHEQVADVVDKYLAGAVTLDSMIFKVNIIMNNNDYRKEGIMNKYFGRKTKD